MTLTGCPPHTSARMSAVSPVSSTNSVSVWAMFCSRLSPGPELCMARYRTGRVMSWYSYGLAVSINASQSRWLSATASGFSLLRTTNPGTSGRPVGILRSL